MTGKVGKRESDRQTDRYRDVRERTNERTDFFKFTRIILIEKVHSAYFFI